jgi:hypothetical protein
MTLEIEKKRKDKTARVSCSLVAIDGAISIRICLVASYILNHSLRHNSIDSRPPQKKPMFHVKHWLINLFPTESYLNGAANRHNCN